MKTRFRREKNKTKSEEKEKKRKKDKEKNKDANYLEGELVGKTSRLKPLGPYDSLSQLKEINAKSHET